MAIAGRCRVIVAPSDDQFWDDSLKDAAHEFVLPRDRGPGSGAPAGIIRWRKVSSPKRDASWHQLLTVAAVAIVLRHYGQGNDVLIGVRTRLMPEALPLRLRIPAGTTSRSLLEMTADRIAEMERHLVPLAWLSDRYPPLGERCPHYAIAFDFADRQAQTIPAEVVVRSEAGVVEFRRSRPLVTEGTAGRLSGHVSVTMRALAADDGCLVEDISPLTADERDEILVKRNDTAIAYRRGATISELVDEQAAVIPDAVAIRFDGASVCYRELVARANLLARQIMATRTRPRAPVGVCIPRGIDMVIAKLAILKTGAPYLPLDPVDSDFRLSNVMRLGEVELTVVSPTTAGRLRAITTTVEAPGRPGGSGGSGGSGCPDEPLAARATASDPAMVLFTSGSTGEPKAVELTHRAITRIADSSSWLRIGRSEVISQSSHLAFDWCAYQIWGALINGARLVVVPQRTLLSPHALSALIRAEQISTLCLTTALFHELASRNPTIFADVTRLLIAGEPLRAADLQRVLLHGPPGHVYNLYGPTENGVFTTCHECSARDSHVVPIGRPVPNTTVYILSPRRTPVADGVVGDLYTGGDGLSPGYRGRSDLTRERFIPNPFGSEPDDMLFDTGDRASYRPDGVIEFHGRRDFQIKIRGVRVEPEEVESQLGRCPNVRLAAVTPSPDSDTNRHLIAFIVPVDAGDVDVQEIRRQLRESLPSALIPGRVIIVEELPLNAHEKIDRDRLAKLAGASSVDTTSSRQDDIEIAIMAVWKDVLQIPEIGPDDDFFAIGGDSRLVMQLVHRINTLFGTDLEPVVLFEASTVAGFSAAIRAWRSKHSSTESDPAEPALVPLSWSQEGLWETCALAGDTPLYNESFTVTVREPLDADALAESLNDLLARHVALRTGFTETGGRVAQQSTDVRTLPLTRTDLSGVPADEQIGQAELLGVYQARLRFALDRPPLARASLIRFAPDHHQLHLVAHHLVSDGTSFSRALARDLHLLYRRRTGQQTPALPPVPDDYLEHARSQRAHITAAWCAAELSRAADELRGARPTELPLLQPRPPMSSFRGARRTGQLPASAVEAITNLSRQHAVTPTTVLFALFQVALHLVTGETDLVTGLVQDTRSRPEQDNVCGTFVNTTPLRCDLSGDPVFSDILARIHRAYVTGQALRGTPLPLMERHLESTLPAPLFRIAFAVQPDSRALEANWHVRFNSLDNGTARLDLTLFADIGETALGLVFEYATDVVSEEVIARLENFIRNVLDTVAVRPGTRLSEFGQARSGKRDDEALSAAQRAVIEVWTTQLGVAPESLDRDFFDVGGNSVRASRLIAAARHRFGIDMGHTSALTQVFLSESTVNGLASGLAMLLSDQDRQHRRPRYPSERIDFAAETVLPADVEFPVSSPTPRNRPEIVLLTGANGFLGSYLLKELLAQTGATIYCLVRAKSRQDAENRIKTSLRDYGAAVAEVEVELDRVVAVPGDLTAHRLGLTEARYDRLAHEVDTIVHNAAWVNFIYPYEKLKSSNVDGTSRMLRLAAAGRPKRLHYISSQGVFSSKGFAGITQVDESTHPTDPHHLLMGYAQSKWASEELLRQARERGLDVSIYRPHDIGGNSTTGAWKTSGFMCALIRGHAEIGAIPDFRLPLDLTPVDITAQAVIELALLPGPTRPVFHLNNPRYALIGDLEESLNDAGHPVRTVPAQEWDGILQRHTFEHPDSVIAPFAHLFTEHWTEQNLSVVELYLEGRMPKIECSATWDLIADSGITCPPGHQLLALYTQYLDRIGFLD